LRESGAKKKRRKGGSVGLLAGVDGKRGGHGLPSPTLIIKNEEKKNDETRRKSPQGYGEKLRRTVLTQGGEKQDGYRLNAGLVIGISRRLDRYGPNEGAQEKTRRSG